MREGGKRGGNTEGGREEKRGKKEERGRAGTLFPEVVEEKAKEVLAVEERGTHPRKKREAYE